MSTPTAPNVRTLHDAAIAAGGAEDSAGKFQFDSLADAVAALAPLGGQIEVPDAFRQRPAALFQAPRQTVAVEVERYEGDAKPPGWIGQKKRWINYLGVDSDQRDDAAKAAEVDPYIRALVVRTAGSEAVDDGWAVRRKNGEWKRTRSRDNAISILKKHRFSKDAIDRMIAFAFHHDWELVSEPFQPIELPGRRWNRGPQYRFKPLPGPHPTWDAVLRHCGQSLDTALRSNSWAVRHGVSSGSLYLLLWLANLLRRPSHSLPYLFMFGPQNSGKSTYHEAIQQLVTGGVHRVDRALKSEQFNGELDGCVLGVIEETSFEGQPAAYSRLKDWVTARDLSIRRMHHDSVMAANHAHFIQCSNERSACPIFAGDTRVTMLRVPMPESEIPKPVLLQRLRDEGPAIMHTILNRELPEPVGRLAIQFIDTEAKQDAIRETDPVAAFLTDKCILTGDVDKAELFAAWRRWCKATRLDPGNLSAFSKRLLASGNVESKQRPPSQSRRPYFAGISLRK